MELEQVVPWGRSLAEYRLMFDLSSADLQRSILGCGDGPASFNAELTERGGRVVSIDPVYQFSADQIRARIVEVCPDILAQLEATRDQYVWDSIRDVDHLAQVRMTAMERFLADYEAGRQAGRYRSGGLPELPFADHEFELALCSHFLFLYSAQVDLQQHIAGMKALCRVAREVRVYPLLTLAGEVSPYLKPVMDSLLDAGVTVEIRRVDYQFQKGATHMLVARSA